MSDKSKIVVFAPDCTAAGVIKRVEAFQACGADVLSFSFRRERYNKTYVPPWENIELGVVRNRNYASRLFALAVAFMIVVRHRKAIRDADAYFAMNLDLVALALIARFVAGSTARIAYLVADIVPLMVSPSFGGRALRFVERWALNRVTTLVVTSPAYVTEYFEPMQGYRGEWFLLENKLYPPYVPPPQEVAAEIVGERWIVGYFGVLKCQRSLDIIRRVAAALPDKADFHLRGHFTERIRQELVDDLLSLDNVSYGGEYERPRDLTKMYGGIDIIWCYDFVNPEHNSRWCRPNRLYEGGFYGLPMIASDDDEAGDYIKERGIGWTTTADHAENLIRLLSDLTPEAYEECRRRYAAITPDTFVSLDEFRELSARLTAR